MTQAMLLGFPCNQLVKWVLTTPVQFVIGWRFHKVRLWAGIIAYRYLDSAFSCGSCSQGLVASPQALLLACGCRQQCCVLCALPCAAALHTEVAQHMAACRRLGWPPAAAGDLALRPQHQEQWRQEQCPFLAWLLFWPQGAWKALKRGGANMDVLVSLGTNASYFYSVISILHHHFSHHDVNHSYVPTDFFETSAFLITFILLGKSLECAAKVGLAQLAC